MKSIAFVILFFSISFISSAQDSLGTALCRPWVIKKGWFGDDYMIFEKLDSAKQELVQVITFMEKGFLNENLYNPKQLGLCGNGQLYFTYACWLKDSSLLRFDVKGGHFAGSKFHYKMSYRIIYLYNGIFILRKEQVELNEEK